MKTALSLLLLLATTAPALAETVTLHRQELTDWKAVYGRIEPRDRVPARARIGGTLVELLVTEGDSVAEGQTLARIVDEKLAFQLSALQSQRNALAAQLANAQSEVTRGEELLKQGVTTTQRVDALRTQADVLSGQLAAVDAQVQSTRQTQTEGLVLAPAAGRILDAPLARGAVVMPGEPVATLAVGGSYLRISVPERLAGLLTEGDPIQLAEGATAAEGRLAKVYPLIENGRVTADVELGDLPDRFLDARILVRLPVGSHPALLVPATALTLRGGIDFVAVETPEGPALRAVVPGSRQTIDGTEQVEILSGLAEGDRVLTVAPTATTGGETE